MGGTWEWLFYVRTAPGETPAPSAACGRTGCIDHIRPGAGRAGHPRRRAAVVGPLLHETARSRSLNIDGVDVPRNWEGVEIGYHLGSGIVVVFLGGALGQFRRPELVTPPGFPLIDFTEIALKAAGLTPSAAHNARHMFADSGGAFAIVPSDAKSHFRDIPLRSGHGLLFETQACCDRRRHSGSGAGDGSKLRELRESGFHEAGARKMRELRTAQINKLIAMMLDGKIISAPRVRSVISNDGVITGRAPNGLSTEEVRRILTSVNQKLK